jgi:hypothetical protein
MDRHHVDADPDEGPTFHFDADPDPDPDPTLSLTHVGKSKKNLLLFTAVHVYKVSSFSSSS